jgi:hypothetical protein
MIPSSGYSTIQRNHVFRNRVRPPAASTVMAAVAAVALAAVAGCSSTSHRTAAAAKPTAAQGAIRLAASDSQQVTSLTAVLNVNAGGTTAGTMTGTVQIQLKPAKLIEAKFDLAPAGSARIHLAEILTSNAIYFNDPSYAKSVGKPWVKASISELSSRAGVTLGALLQNLESSNPLDQATLFTSSTDVYRVGAAPIGGVAMTEYAGSYSPSTAFKALSAAQRALIGPMLRSIGTNPVHFRVWIDGQHLIRKAETTDSVGGRIVTTSFDVIAVNQPIRVTVPSAHDVAPLPKL